MCDFTIQANTVCLGQSPVGAICLVNWNPNFTGGNSLRCDAPNTDAGDSTNTFEANPY